MLGVIMIIEVKSHKIISEILRDSGIKLASGCSAHKGCGKCTVKLHSGIWECRGKLVSAPAQAVACCTFLKSDTGSIEIPETHLLSPQTNEDWQGTLPMPDDPRTVIAVDMGTTTLAAVRIEYGQVVAKASSFNGQQHFGYDIMTRIANSGQHFAELRRLLIDSVTALLEQLEFRSAARIGVAGNSTECCFLHGIDPSSIGIFPFRAPQIIFPERFDLWDGVPVFTVPCMTGLLGGDITAALYEIPLEPGEMLIDLGTNCEIVFNTSSGLLGTSAAAGPAFEGAGISCGSMAVEGAIDHFFSNGRFSVIGGKKPRSVCGSGLVDFLAAAHHMGTLDKFGRFLSGASEMEIAPGVVITEEDIAELLKAKAAVAGAIKTLESFSGTKVAKIKLAGGFARYLNIDSACRIGMLPNVPVGIHGNLSLAGAARFALTPEAALPMAEQSKKIRELHLNEIPGFTGFFTSSLALR